MAAEGEARVIVRLPSELKRQVEASAQRNVRSVNGEIEFALRQHVAASTPMEPRPCE